MSKQKKFYFGKIKLTSGELARKFGISKNAFTRRMNKGYKIIDEKLVSPIRKNHERKFGTLISYSSYILLQESFIGDYPDSTFEW